VSRRRSGGHRSSSSGKGGKKTNSTSQKRHWDKDDSSRRTWGPKKNDREHHHVDPEMEQSRKKADELLKAFHNTQETVNQWLQKASDIQNQTSSEFTLDPWQQEALDALLNGESVIIDAPTTAGKTRIVEAFFKINLENSNFRAAYTAPVKSLSNDKLREFSDMFGAENIGIATGDVKDNLHAPIVVATLESYRNSLLGVEPDLGRSLVVFDEYHFMQDTGRGSAWEEAMILTPQGCQLLLLSASVENPKQFCDWIETISKRRCRLIKVTERPVPLVDLVFYHDRWYLADELSELKLIKQNPALTRFPLEHNEVARRLKSILNINLTPCIVYAGRRLSCENMATAICKHIEPLSVEQSNAIKHALENECDVDDPTKFMKPNLRRMLLVYGVGYHHSGIAPAGRRAIEILVKKGLLRFCVATMGLSIGINFSVRSAVISDYQRPGEAGFTLYPASEVLQMLGRAGRRGKDAVGFSLWPSTQSYIKFGQAKRENVSSRLKNDPTTFLGLLGREFKLRDIESFYEKSFLRFGNRKTQFKLIRHQPLSKSLNESDLPCKQSPASAYAKFLAEDRRSSCQRCQFRNKCHKQLEKQYSNPLAFLHLHLHWLGCIDENEKLTSYGHTARYFPQAGGLVVAYLIDQKLIREDNLLSGLELLASLSLARFKEPEISAKYRFPFDPEEIAENLEDFYPIELFEELYDPPNPRRADYLYKEYNPLAGFIVREWISGVSWQNLKQNVCHEKFAEGDLMALIYRSATYLQSIAQTHLPGLSQAARALRDELIKDPL
jgi:superfamily II RNA helicase